MAKKAPHEGKIRESIVDGIFYPAEEEELTALIESLLEKSGEDAGNAFAIISPHAGYSYAGEIIARSFKASAKRNIKDVVILAPIHTDPIDHIFLPESKFFLTPLGSLKVNQELADELLSCSTNILRKDLPHLEEHCIEVHLPFIKYLFPEANIVPILLGNSSLRNIKILSNALQLTFAPVYSSTLFVVSSNMTTHMNKEIAEHETKTLIDLITKIDWKGIATAKVSGEISSCGAACIATILSFNDIEYDIRVTSTGSSESLNEDKGDIVNYASISIYNKKENRTHGIQPH
jgi:AmmeMemoRadiSam system protein B